MSVLETCRRQTRSALDYLSHTLRSVGNLLLPRLTVVSRQCCQPADRQSFLRIDAAPIFRRRRSHVALPMAILTGTATLTF